MGLNYWPNFLRGCNHSRHVWRGGHGKDRVDGVDGWGSPEVEWAQAAFHPYLAMDVETYSSNPLFTTPWPSSVPAVRCGMPVSRQVIVFNDGITDGVFQLHWSARWDSPSGQNI